MSSENSIAANASNGKGVSGEVISVSPPRDAQCYCGEPRRYSEAEFQCCQCSRWFHKACIKFNVGSVLPFMTNYHFMCKSCNNRAEEVFNRKQASFAVMCQTALANLTVENGGQCQFSVDQKLIPYLEENWDALASQPRRGNKSWYVTIHKTVASSDTFKVTKVSASEPSQDQPQEDSLVSLANSDLSRIGPNYDQFRALASGLKTDLSKLNVQMPGRGKRRAGPGADLRGTRSRLEAERVKVNAQGFPVEHPFNKDNYRYTLAEPDLHAPGRQQWDQCESTSGQPIPGYFYRAWAPPALLLSMSDRAPQLKLAENQLSVTGDKGYCMIRATHGVSKGAWYFEASVVEMPEGSAARIGWSAALGNLQAPVGCDKFSYSWRSRKGTAFHDARGRHYTESGYRQGDIIGCLIVLQEPTQVTLDCLPPTHKSSQLIKFKNCLYYEERDEVQKQEKSLRLQLGSEIRFYRNGQPMGVAFGKLYANTYYPAISLYKAAQVQANFGPEFRYQPTDVADWLPMCQRVEEQAVEQCLAEIVDNLDGADRLDRMLTK
ncbi:hypothetical protein BOX15_Mlig010759g2 [Macrostomum lignano]|uniref:B30.2/SPRY domain-containing protein n=2 Tax=Macrostomum lignano TaxID=282301 RepID=A0A1I8HZG0_9PLAT|nr:hypothetical protein BOX15_Mlig010759g2 [Macrostomum lignano]